MAEHLWFFASLKQTPPDRVMEEVESFMKNVGLADKADSYARELSGLLFFAFLGNVLSFPINRQWTLRVS